MQDDSNSESTFEFVDDKKTDDTLKSGMIPDMVFACITT